LQDFWTKCPEVERRAYEIFITQAVGSTLNPTGADKEGGYTVQEETTQKTIALAIKTSKLTASVLQKAMKMYLEHQKHKEPSHGKIPVKKLVGQGEGAKSIEVTDSNIRSFERVARKYNVDFAVKRDKTTEPPKYLVFFKGKDADVIAQAFKEFVKVNEKKQQRPSLRQKLKGLQKIVAQNKNRERSREKNKDRGQSL